MVQSFVIVKGKAIVCIMFEKVPYWITALSPLSCRRLVFAQYSSRDSLCGCSGLCETFVKSYLDRWPSDKILYNQNSLPHPDLVLVSGSQRFLSMLDEIQYQAPVIFVHELARDSKLSHPLFTFGWYKHNLNGGCTNLRIRVGFRNMCILHKIGSMQRALGDFIEYSAHPDTPIEFEKIDPATHLVKDSCLTFHSLNKPVVLPTYKFSSGWGHRKLTRKELCHIWGLSDLEGLQSISIPS